MAIAARHSSAIDSDELTVLRAAWHPVSFSESVDQEPASVQLLGCPLVVCRIAGRVVVAHDRCPHRGSPLSLGTYQVDGLACPYHGLRFAADGRCVAFPARPDARLPTRLALDLVESCEAHGLIWARLNPSREQAVPPEWSTFDREDLQKFQAGPVRWRVNASRVVENFNDLAHFATIHAVTFGPSPGPTPLQEISETEAGLTSEVDVIQQNRNTLDGSVDEVVAHYRYDFTFPFSSRLTITYPSGELEFIHLAAMPESATSCLVFQQSARTNIADDPLEPWRDFEATVNEEDRVMCEALRPRIVSFGLADTREVALPTDVFSIAYRRRWRQLLDKAGRNR